MIKALRNIYIRRKTRNLTRIPVFTMIGGGTKYDKLLKLRNANT